MGSPSKIEVLSQEAKRDPSNAFKWRDLIIECLHQGRERDVVLACTRAFTALDRTPSLPEKFHIPVLREMESKGLVTLLEMICRDLDIHYDTKEDESLKRAVRRARRAISREFDGGVFPPSIPEEEWWSEGPHVFRGSADEEGTIFPGRIIALKDGKAELLLMSILTSSGLLETGTLEIDSDALGNNKASEGDFFEVLINEDSPLVFAWHT